MIQGRLDERGVVLSARLPAGSVSYVDRDWLTAAESPVPSLSFTPEGDVFWCGQQCGSVTAGTDLTMVAARALLGVAREAATAVTERLRGAVEVVGTGLVAEHVRRLTAPDREHRGESPGAVVDTTGEPQIIRSALDRVSDLGTVVLAGETLGRRLDLDLYSSVHTRGLVLVGIAPPLLGGEIPAVADVDDEDLRWCRDALGDASESPAPNDSLWYRIVA